MKTVILDPGHGGKDLGVIAHEKELNLMLSMKVREKLLEHYRVKVLMTRTKDQFKSLRQRTRFANRHKGDYFCSIHHNGKNQLESHIVSGHVRSCKSQNQDRLHGKIIEVLSIWGITDERMEELDLGWLKRTKMCAVLIKIPVFDKEKNGPSYARYKDLTASAIADGLAEIMHLPAVERPLYRVIAGSFLNVQTAMERVRFLEQQQIDAFVAETEKEGKTYYRVHAGAFRTRRRAELRMRELRRMRLYEPFIAVGNEPSESEPFLMKILGPARFHGKEMDEYARYLNPDAPRLGQYYEDIGRHYGVRGDIAFAQALLETRHFRFTGALNPEQHNYARLGAASRNDPGDRFTSPQSGVLAHIQHLFALASKEPLPEGYPLVDRHFLSEGRGTATTWLELNRASGEEYGQTILNQYEQMADYLSQKKTRCSFIKKILRCLKIC